ncbi:YdbL family protein [Thermomonas sp.]|uniref:YdbL family protein n=1 Tax=Thermomonas sp. TaxID=1971895 RepID=UPI00261B0BEB|nr:YdbL family protein [Thermomonas sp.]
MKQWMGVPVAGALLLSACVTINVYFPAAEAKEAAKEFVEKVINDADKVQIKQEPASGGGMAVLDRRIELDLSRFDPWVLVGVGSARAQSAPDISIKTPAIQAIQSRMESRFSSSLRAGFDSGALGFTADGLISVRDASKVELKDRVALNSAVADDNRDRNAVYREVAVANGHPEWETQIRGVFAKQWVSSAKSGWWYQTGGAWKQK